MSEATVPAARPAPSAHRHRLEPLESVPEDAAADLFQVLLEYFPDAPAALLDSSDHARTVRPERSRRSILAFSHGPHAAEVRHSGGLTATTGPKGGSQRAQPFFEWLRENWNHRGETAPSGPAEPFLLGWVGWLGYELKREMGSPDAAAASRRGANPGVPEDDARLFWATHAVVITHSGSAAGPVHVEAQSWGDDEEWAALVQRLWSEVVSAGSAAAGDSPADPGSGSRVSLRNLQVRDSRTEYLEAIAQAQHQIAEGNSYEICLTTAVSAEVEGTGLDSFSVFRALRARNRAPFTQYLRWPDVAVCSTSPERYLSIDAAGTVRSEPIKGTRPRGAHAAEDAELHEDLRTHPKDRAENVMITDLVRNDLSRYAVPGTLRTERLCAVESYATVHQMVSTVSAQIAEDASRADVVATAFPPGSMTGAPKISTMNILEDLESGPRGIYSGAAGYFSTTGAADLSVMIRTAVFSNDDAARTTRLHLGLGGAITADSDPAAEWDEVRTKSVGVLSTLGVSFPDR